MNNTRLSILVVAGMLAVPGLAHADRFEISVGTTARHLHSTTVDAISKNDRHAIAARYVLTGNQDVGLALPFPRDKPQVGLLPTNSVGTLGIANDGIVVRVFDAIPHLQSIPVAKHARIVELLTFPRFFTSNGDLFELWIVARELDVPLSREEEFIDKELPL